MDTIISERLILRPLALTDIDAFHHYAKKPDIGPMAGWKPHESLAESAQILTQMIKDGDVWGIQLKTNDHLIGTIGLHVRSFENALAMRREIGYVLDDSYWGQGLMTEAVIALMHHAFIDLGLLEIVCGHEISNHRSRRVIEKVGFQPTHTERRPHFDHTEVVIQMYAMTEHEFQGGTYVNTQTKI